MFAVDTSSLFTNKDLDLVSGCVNPKVLINYIFIFNLYVIFNLKGDAIFTEHWWMMKICSFHNDTTNLIPRISFHIWFILLSYRVPCLITVDIIFHCSLLINMLTLTTSFSCNTYLYRLRLNLIPRSCERVGDGGGGCFSKKY